MSGAKYFDDGHAINPFMGISEGIVLAEAIAEHTTLKQTLESLGVTVVTTAPPPHLQDGVYTANWALDRKSVV